MHFKHQYELTKHARIHSAERPYQCEWCLATFKHSSTLAKHRREVCFKTAPLDCISEEAIRFLLDPE